MNEQGMQTGRLLENEAARQFLQLLAENRPGMGAACSMMHIQMDSMEKQLDKALAELHEVRGQLAGRQENPAESFVSSTAGAVEGRLHGLQEHLGEMKRRIVEGAGEAVEGFRHTGVKALDRAVSDPGIKKALEAIQESIGESIADVKKSIEKVEGLGYELRSAGHFQTEVLLSLRVEKIFLDRFNSIALSAIGNVERLEQAAGHTKGEAVLEAGQEKQEAPDETAGPDVLEPSTGKGIENPSILKDLQEKKAQAAPRPSPVPDRGRKSQEAAL